MRKGIFTLVGLFLLMAACGKKEGGKSTFPDNFNSLGDQGKVAWMMENVSPDSVARFICYASLGKIDGTKIDTLATATLYAYENYRDSAAIAFGDEFDRVVNGMPLPDKMRMLAMAGNVDPQALGYELGLEYVGNIRENQKTLDEVENELREFKKACASDTATYQRFLIGFRTVLRVDSGKDINREIYNKFIDYE